MRSMKEPLGLKLMGAFQPARVAEGYSNQFAFNGTVAIFDNDQFKNQPVRIFGLKDGVDLLNMVSV